MSNGLATLAIPLSGGAAPNVGKELSSKSGARREVSVSKQTLVVVRPTSMGFLNQGKMSLSAFLGKKGPLPTGVTGVVSREVKCDRSLGEGEWLSGGGLSSYSNIDFRGGRERGVSRGRLRGGSRQREDGFDLRMGGDGDGEGDVLQWEFGAAATARQEMRLRVGSRCK